MTSMFGIGLRLAATAFFAAMSLCVRLSSVEAPVGQIVFYRSAFALVPVFVYLAWRREIPSGFRTGRIGAHAARSVFGCTTMVMNFTAIGHLPLVLVTALGFVGPLLVVPAAMIFLRERPGFVVVATALSGFVGVGLMLMPAFQGPSLDAATLVGLAAALASAVTGAATKVQIKTLTATEPAGTITFYFCIVAALMGLATLPFGWAPASFDLLMPLVASGILGGCAQICLTEALARMPASTLAPFEYTALIWALLFDVVVFGLVPTPAALAGAVVVVGSAAALVIAERFRAPAAGDPA